MIALWKILEAKHIHDSVNMGDISIGIKTIFVHFWCFFILTFWFFFNRWDFLFGILSDNFNYVLRFIRIHFHVHFIHLYFSLLFFLLVVDPNIFRECLKIMRKKNWKKSIFDKKKELQKSSQRTQSNVFFFSLNLLFFCSSLTTFRRAFTLFNLMKLLN